MSNLRRDTQVPRVACEGYRQRNQEHDCTARTGDLESHLFNDRDRLPAKFFYLIRSFFRRSHICRSAPQARLSRLASQCRIFGEVSDLVLCSYRGSDVANERELEGSCDAPCSTDETGLFFFPPDQENTSRGNSQGQSRSCMLGNANATRPNEQRVCRKLQEAFPHRTSCKSSSLGRASFLVYDATYQLRHGDAETSGLLAEPSDGGNRDADEQLDHVGSISYG